MNYWPRWISAIRKRTIGLSLAQMGAYDRLLDHYYAEEGPLPADLGECCRIAGAMSKPEREAVQFVLSKFFTLTDAGHTNERADEEILLALPKIAAAQANGKRGGRPKKPSGLPGGNPAATQSKSSPSPSSEIHTEPPPDCAHGACEVEGFVPTPAGTVCKALRQSGIPDTNPGHPRLTTLLDAGATVAEFTAFVGAATGKSSPFLWLLGAVEGERARATTTAAVLHRGPLPASETPYQRSMRERMTEFAGSSAKPPPGPQLPTAEVIDVTARRLG